MRKTTKTKYSAFINDCYHHVTFDKNLMRDSHEVSNNLLRAMANKNVIRVDAGTGRWIGATPNPIMMNEIFREYNRLVDIDLSKRKSKPHGKQLTIQPIKRAERPVPQSIIELNEKISEYPILDVAIAFLAGMVVAAFFTLIWK
jgi:hypothetical protein